MPESFLYTIWGFIIALSIFRYFEENICIASLTYGRKIVSFIVGAMVPIIFLELLNDVYLGIHSTHNLLALLLPTGFVISYLVERHIYLHLKSKRKKRELHNMYMWIAAVSAFFLGIIFATNIKTTLYEEILYLITFCLFHVMSSVYIHHIDVKQTSLHSNFIKRIFFALSPVYGFAIASYFGVSAILNVAMLAIFVGAFMHLIVDDLLKEEKETVPSYFILGALVFTMLFLIDMYVIG